MVNQSYHELKKCLCCNNENLRKILDLREQPLANNSLSNKYEEENTYPLKLNFCNNCTHLQLKHAVNPDLMFKHYLYVTGTSQTMRDYLRSFVSLSETYLSLNNKKVMDIACNDGTLLDIYRENGYETFGIDPSENLYKISSKNHKIELDYLNDTHAIKYNNQFDLVIAQNVMAHNSYPKHFLEICKEMVTENGFIFIQNSQADMTINNEFDTIYHEHLSFYNIKSMKFLAKSVGLTMVDVQRVPIHGNSHVFVFSKNINSDETNISDSAPLNDEIIDNMIEHIGEQFEEEESDGRDDSHFGRSRRGTRTIH
jgi:2-polyprenyl-3-methyl-5-hydroxy-6-metoxy-1,4-benzoquinol methylase